MDGNRTPIIVWFREDLRLSDNPALHAAAAGDRPVVPLYILDDDGPPRAMGGASRWWLDKSLRSLAESLKSAGSPLVLRRGDTLEALQAVVAETGAGGLVWNRLHDRKSLDRDVDIAAAMARSGVETASHNASLINAPDAVTTGAGGAFKVFTPYHRAARAAAVVSAHGFPAPRLVGSETAVASDDLSSWALHPTSPDWSTGFEGWTPGEAGAGAQLNRFLGAAAKTYAHGRNVMGAEGVSRLSAHLRFGEIGPRQIWRAVSLAAERDDIDHDQADTYLKELIWREFNYSLLFHNPHITHRPFNPAFSNFEWRNDEAGFRAWTKGLTGFPIVDAAMRQLWTTGWMHNRARMITASFLVKDLLVDWRRGEAWFWDTLVDADLANNVTNWQWVAGSGADAAPFFRIFNPVLQGSKFDAQGLYVRRWVPELAGLSDRDIHQPWNVDPAVLERAGVEFGVSYPRPIVDHAFARNRALAAYARL